MKKGKKMYILINRTQSRVAEADGQPATHHPPPSERRASGKVSQFIHSVLFTVIESRAVVLWNNMKINKKQDPVVSPRPGPIPIPAALIRILHPAKG